jgi:hypothetical protein
MKIRGGVWESELGSKFLSVVLGVGGDFNVVVLRPPGPLGAEKNEFEDSLGI